jgi:hypothetical protein
MSKRNDLIKHNEHTAKYARKENDAQPFLMIFPQEIVFLIMIFMDMHTLDNFLLTCQTISGWFRTKQLYDTWKMDKLMQATDRIFNVLHNYPKGVGEVIIDLVKKENGVVAGGFVLQFISNTTFENTSIDIYIPCDISENEEEAIKNTTKKIEEYFEYLGFGMISKTIMSNNVLTLLAFNTDIYTIKIFLVACGVHKKFDNIIFDMHTFVDVCFDFSFCKCTFDGECIKSNNVLGQLRKCGTIDNNSVCYFGINPKNGLERIKRLMKRSERVLKRIAKYKRRGFKLLHNV